MRCRTFIEAQQLFQTSGVGIFLNKNVLCLVWKMADHSGTTAVHEHLKRKTGTDSYIWMLLGNVWVSVPKSLKHTCYWRAALLRSVSYFPFPSWFSAPNSQLRRPRQKYIRMWVSIRRSVLIFLYFSGFLEMIVPQECCWKTHPYNSPILHHSLNGSGKMKRLLDQRVFALCIAFVP